MESFGMMGVRLSGLGSKQGSLSLRAVVTEQSFRLANVALTMWAKLRAPLRGRLNSALMTAYAKLPSQE
jgi:hypothetical protein